MGACKDKDKEVDPENNFAAEFVGNYYTLYIDGQILSEHTWDVERLDNNRLKIAYTQNRSTTISGQNVPILTQKWNLTNVTTTSGDQFSINETVDVEQSSGAALKQKVVGVGTKVINASGVQQINIEMALTNTATGVEEKLPYLEFKKK